MRDDLEAFRRDVAQVPWASYSHAYGAATDVEQQLLDLVSTDAERRGEALHAAFGNLWHQGTVYEATAHAVPFLLRALEVPHVAERPTLLMLLACMAQGSSYHDVHGFMHEASRRESAEYQGQLAAELSWVESARLAVAEGLPQIAGLLEAPSAPVRAAAAYALASCPEEAGAHLAALEAAFDEEQEPDAQLSLALALARVGHEAGATQAIARRLREALARSDAGARLAGAAGLACLGVSDDAVIDGLSAGVALREVLDTSCWNEGGDGVLFLVRLLGETHERQVELLLRLLRHDDPEVQRAALFAAGELSLERGTTAAAFMSTYVDLLRADDPRLREQALRTIAQAGGAARGAADALLAFVERGADDPRVLAEAATTLVHLRDRRIVPWLAGRLNALSEIPDEFRGVLGELGPWAPELLEPLLGLLARQSSSGSAAIPLVGAVGRYGAAAAEAVPLLVRWLEAGLELAASLALAEIGPPARAALPALRPLLAGEDWGERANAARAVWEIAGDAPAVLGALRPLLASEDRHFVPRALEVLERMGEAAREFEPRARELLQQEDLYGWTTVRAARFLVRLGVDAEELLPVLRAHVESKPVGELAVACLRDLGPAAAAALPELRAQLGDAVGGRGYTAEELVDAHEAWVALCREAIVAIEG
ncbi:MAG: hypothetical protein R3F62_03170 [Planctomycetota bacterium]